MDARPCRVFRTFLRCVSVVNAAVVQHTPFVTLRDDHVFGQSHDALPVRVGETQRTNPGSGWLIFNGVVLQRDPGKQAPPSWRKPQHMLNNIAPRPQLPQSWGRLIQMKRLREPIEGGSA